MIAFRERHRTDRPALLVFSDDWGRHPSSCQHLAQRLLDRYEILWVNTIGMRTPSLNLATLKRGFEKFVQWALRPKQEQSLPENLQVANPRMWPWFTTERDRRINRRLLLRNLLPLVEARSGPVTAITTIPIVADLIGALPVSDWVYYCVDDFSVWPGLDQQTLLRMETELIRKADRCIAAGETLQRRIQAAGRECSLLTHGVDADFWRNGNDAAVSIADWQEADLPEGLVQSAIRNPKSAITVDRPLIVFWGVVDRRMDTAMIRRLAHDLDRGTILLVGPEQDPDPELTALPRVKRLPPLPFESLPALAAEAAVLIMPYIDAEVTRAMQPLKLKEYLATGKPAVVRELPSTSAWRDCLDTAATPEEFSRLVRRRLAGGLPAEQRTARRRLVHETWDGKARLFEQLAFSHRTSTGAVA